MQLDLRLLEVFCEVYRERSFSAAGRSLSLSQPTVSEHIRHLESQLGVILFDRVKQRVLPTRAAALLYSHGRAIVRRKEAALQELKQFLDCLQGTLQLQSSTIPAEYLLPALLAGFHKEYPGIDMEVRISDSVRTCTTVLEGDAELGLTGARLKNKNLRFFHFAADELALVVPAQIGLGKTLSLEKLLKVPFIAREEGSGTRSSFERMVGRKLADFTVAATLGSTSAVKEALKTGLGVSVISLLAVRAELEQGLLRVVKIRGIPSLRRDFFVVQNRQRSLSPVARTFLKFALNHRP